jgi:DnaD/phage-associated family protein
VEKDGRGMKKPQTIFRVVHNPNNPYVIIDKRPLEKPYMSWKAKGLLSYLLSRPDDWTVRLGDLVKRSTDKAHATRQALRELIIVGHMRQVEYRHPSGKYAGTVYEVHETPLYENPLAVFPKAEKRILNNIDSSNKEIQEEETPQKNLFVLYEQEIGIITPLIADSLSLWEKEVPEKWIIDAMTEAVRASARRWNYIEAILKRWKEQGNQEPAKKQVRTNGKAPQPTVADNWLARKQQEAANGNS